jgi:hypothetical protein
LGLLSGAAEREGPPVSNARRARRVARDLSIGVCGIIIEMSVGRKDLSRLSYKTQI